MSNRSQINIAGAFTGPIHRLGAYVLSFGNSLHPLQRSGILPATGFPTFGLPAIHFTDAPMAGGPQLAMPPILNVSISSALHQVRVS